MNSSFTTYYILYIVYLGQDSLSGLQFLHPLQWVQHLSHIRIPWELNILCMKSTSQKVWHVVSTQQMEVSIISYTHLSSCQWLRNSLLKTIKLYTSKKASKSGFFLTDKKQIQICRCGVLGQAHWQQQMRADINKKHTF